MDCFRMQSESSHILLHPWGLDKLNFPQDDVLLWIRGWFYRTAEAAPGPCSLPPCPVAFCSHRDEPAAAPRGPQFTMWQMKINGSLHYVGGDEEEGWAAFRCVSAIHSSSSAFSNPTLGQTSASIYVPDFCRPHTSKTTTLENYRGYILATLIRARAQDPGLLLKSESTGQE